MAYSQAFESSAVEHDRIRKQNNSIRILGHATAWASFFFYFRLLRNMESSSNKNASIFEGIYMQILGLVPPKFHLLVKDLESSDEFFF